MKGDIYPILFFTFIKPIVRMNEVMPSGMIRGDSYAGGPKLC